MATDVVMRHGFTENYQVYHNVEHKWYYLGNQGADEVIVFRQTDTEANNATGEHITLGNEAVLILHRRATRRILQSEWHDWGPSQGEH